MQFRFCVEPALLSALICACHSSAPGSAAPAVSPVGVEWRLTALGGAPAGNGSNGLPVTLLLSEESGRASGYAGCNQYSGIYTITGSAITIGPLAMTRMACSKGEDLERRYTMALAEATDLKVTDKGLELRKGSTPLAKFTR